MPKDLKPYFYEIFIKPFFNVTQQPDMYHGNVLIRFKCTKNTSKLILHSHEEIEISNNSLELSSLTDPNFKALTKLNWNYETKTQFFIVNFNNVTFTEGNNYALNIGFKGHLKSDNAGFYKSSYTDEDGYKRFNIKFQ